MHSQQPRHSQQCKSPVSERSSHLSRGCPASWHTWQSSLTIPTHVTSSPMVAQRHNGPGWREYDKIFRQHAALNPSVQWNEVNASLHAATILTFRSGPSQSCSICHEPDHGASACAMMVLEPQHPQQLPCPQPLFRSGAPLSAWGTRKPVRPETLERICVSWNRGKCTFSDCQFRHICATCKRRGHKAKECEETAASSPYKVPPSSPAKPTGGSTI